MNNTIRKKVCVIMPFRLLSDSRSIKTIKVLNQYCLVDVYYFDYEESDNDFFNENTKLFGLQKPKGLKNFIFRHTLFYNEFNYFAKEVLKRKEKYDYVWAHDLPVLRPALKLKKIIGSKVVYDCHELYIETLNQFFPENSRGIKKLLLDLSLKFMVKFGSIAERRMIKRVDTCVTVGNKVKDYIERTLPITGVLVIYNWPYLQTTNEKVDLRKLLALNQNDKILLYQGVMNQGRGLIEMIQAQKHTNSNIKFVLMGDGPMKSELQKLVIDLNLQDKIIFIDRVNPTVLLQYTRGADAGIVLQDVNKNMSKKLGIANKFFEYMHAGIPFVATDAPENRIVFDKFELCTLVDPKHDINEIADAINDLFENNLEIYKRNAFEASKVYNWDKQEDIIKSIVN
ncbi:MAG: glycosyltransferase family 4 protein [Bacteroidales bacterium]|nr:glycosyltransferase family 4 protein [Bacteroidales bacterium]